MKKKDLLEEVIGERTKENPRFPELVREAAVRRKLSRTTPRITHDPRANAAYVSLVNIAPGEAVRQQVVGGDIVLDYDANGKLLGIEVLDARRLLRESTLATADSERETSK